MCEPDWKASMLGSCYSLPWFFVLLILPRVADRAGRKWVFTVSRLFETLAFIVVLFAKDYYLMMVCLIIVGLCSAGRLNVGTVYLSEWFPTRWQTAI